MKTKTLTIAFAISAISALLSAQAQTNTQTRIRMMDPSSMTLPVFYRSVASSPPASLVIFDTKDREWQKDFAQIIREDPFAVLNLRFIPLSVDQGAGSELREKEGWPMEAPHWAIYNTEGRCVADGATLPTSAQLADACSSAGIRSKVESYRRFLREHPNHEEAQTALLKEMAEVATKRTRYALQIPENRAVSDMSISASLNSVGTSISFDQDPSSEQIESLPELTPEVDDRIWRDYCLEFQRYLGGVLWQVGDASSREVLVMTGSNSVVSPWAIFSPLARAAYKKAAPVVEAALARQPSSTTIWRLWATLNKTGAGSSMKELLETLEPSPTVTRANWPPESVMAEYIRSCRETGDWNTIVDLVKPGWDLVSSMVNFSSQQRGGTPSQTSMVMIEGPDGRLLMDVGNPFLSQSFWTSKGEAYLEALLRRQRLAEAEQMMKTWASNSGWPGAFPAAAVIAEKLGFESAAKSWRELGNPKK